MYMKTSLVLFALCFVTSCRSGSLFDEQQCPDGCCSGKTCGAETNANTTVWSCGDINGDINLKHMKCYISASGTKTACTTACSCVAATACTSCFNYSDGTKVCTCAATKRNADCGATDTAVSSCMVFTKNSLCIQRCTVAGGLQLLDCQDSVCGAPSVPAACQFS